uniref:GATA-type domain-containing protein n=1 Tax=Mycena chlorophos TaxID=658473 RepID=A0ABQ0L5D9_MYCCL|nr:predicted protein [Mycena chlorophos]
MNYNAPATGYPGMYYAQGGVPATGHGHHHTYGHPYPHPVPAPQPGPYNHPHAAGVGAGHNPIAFPTHQTGSAYIPATPCPVCENTNPTEMRRGCVSETLVCNACAKYEQRTGKLRSKEKEALRQERINAGAWR